MEERVLHRPGQWERLGAFAGSHFLFSVFGAVVLVVGGLIGLKLESQYGYKIFFALLLFANTLYLMIYVLLGRRAAVEQRWLAPVSVVEGVFAFLLPALIAWAWGGLVLAACEQVGLDSYYLATGMLWISLALASPSFLMVFTATAFGWMDSGVLNMILCVLVVGGLPPLLFLLGSIWGSRKAEHSTAQPEEETEVPDETQQRDTPA